MDEKDVEELREDITEKKINEGDFESLLKRTILSTVMDTNSKATYENRKPTKEETNKKFKIEKNKEGQWAWKE